MTKDKLRGRFGLALVIWAIISLLIAAFAPMKDGSAWDDPIACGKAFFDLFFLCFGFGFVAVTVMAAIKYVKDKWLLIKKWSDDLDRDWL